VRYYRPTTTTEAVTALAAEAGTARVLVGGTDLLVALRHRTIEPSLIVDIKKVRDLMPPVAVDADGITFGPTMTMSGVASHPDVRRWFPGLSDAALLVGSVAIRNRASLIANSANGSPAADTSPPLIALDAAVTITSTSGERSARLRDFFLGPRRTLCGPGEMVTSIRVPRPAPGSSSCYLRMTRRRGVDLATVSVAAVVDRAGRATVGLGAVGPITLLGGPTAPIASWSRSEVDQAVDELLTAATPIGDVRAGQPYRAAMLRVLTRRAVLCAAGRRDGRGRTGPSARSAS
jgi:carbon-monoxide dehydrogenase medium subunit